MKVSLSERVIVNQQDQPNPYVVYKLVETEFGLARYKVASAPTYDELLLLANDICNQEDCRLELAMLTEYITSERVIKREALGVRYV